MPELRIYSDLYPVTCTAAWTASLHENYGKTFRVSYQCQYFTWDV